MIEGSHDLDNEGWEWYSGSIWEENLQVAELHFGTSKGLPYITWLYQENKNKKPQVNEYCLI
jgi:hypothetical protein